MEDKIFLTTSTFDNKNFLDSLVYYTRDFDTSTWVNYQKALPDRYIVNKNAAILFWNDDKKTVVKRCKEDKNDPIKAFLWAYFQEKSGLSKTQANKYLEKILDNLEEK